MRKIFFLIILTIFLILYVSSLCIATDRSGCLTCHRYPGLVKFEKPDKVKVLHIDEEKHLASAHGKTDCRDCHTKILQIPHTDETEVDCTTKCHLEDKEKIMAIDASTLSKYHENEKFAITRLDEKSSCRVCHPLYPHSENKKVRALVNMHTGFMLCEVCHLKKENLNNITYEWKEPEEFEFIGEPYGTHQKKEIKNKTEKKSIISKMLRIFSSEEDESEETHKTIYLISRIAVYKKTDGNKELLINTSDIEAAKEFLKNEENLKSEERQKKLNYFHRDIAKKEISVACNECHSPTGILDFRKLGFDEKKAQDLEYLNIKSLVTKYETFYLPNLFGH